MAKPRWVILFPLLLAVLVACSTQGSLWPARISDKGTLRSQFHHVIDIAPTILEVVGIGEPSMVNGVPQTPIEGVETFVREVLDWEA